MSEYQYYEFRAIDRPLTDKQQNEVASLSSRAEVTSRQASFVYNYGDFRGNAEQLMETHFDIMIYMANWGTRRLMVRIPRALIDMKQIASFCISEEIGHWTSKDGKSVILDLNFRDDDRSGRITEGWIEGEGWLNELVDLRDELIRGDFRVLYLAWMKAAEWALAIEEIEGDSLEPPVPYGLKQLSNALKAYVRFLEIDTDMLTVAAQCSEEQPVATQMEQWINKLSDAEKKNKGVGDK